MNEIHSEIIIVGAGAAGLAASIAAGDKAIVLEKMPRPARKIMITGKGRCNFTNVKNWEEFSTHIHPKPNVLKSAFFNLTPEKLIGMFEEAGLSCVVERGQRAFPESHKAVDVVDTLVKISKQKGARITCNCAVTDIIKEDGSFILKGSNGLSYSCDRLIVTCGGLSYPTTGSDGDGYRFAEAFGHKLTRLYPSLTALVPQGYKCIDKGKDGTRHLDRKLPLGALGRKMMGRSMKNVTASLYVDSQLVQYEFGDIDFTDGGIEGPIGFKLSRRAVIALENGSKVAFEITFKDGSKPLRFEIAGYVGYERAVVTAGGISTDGIIAKTMESRLIPGLYFAGEILDIDGDTGGYNLHTAFCTGYLAGVSASISLRSQASPRPGHTRPQTGLE